MKHAQLQNTKLMRCGVNDNKATLHKRSKNILIIHDRSMNGQTQNPYRIFSYQRPQYEITYTHANETTIYKIVSLIYVLNVIWIIFLNCQSRVHCRLQSIWCGLKYFFFFFMTCMWLTLITNFTTLRKCCYSNPRT